MIISSGYNIAGPEVENALLMHPAVAECAVVGKPDAERGSIVKAFVVLRAGHEASLVLGSELQDYVKAAIAPYKYPREVEFIDSLPKTQTGKIQRFRLRQDVTTIQQAILADGWQRPKGYSNAVLAEGRMLFIAGQIGWDENEQFVGDDFIDQVRQALSNTVALLQAAGAGPQHLTRMTWYLTDKREYLARLRELGQVYREVIGNHYPAMTALEVTALIEDRAKVEIESTAVIPFVVER
jgi:enamine deaminase RidA (YjgF/YER057c/UK114 family)